MPQDHSSTSFTIHEPTNHSKYYQFIIEQSGNSLKIWIVNQTGHGKQLSNSEAYAILDKIFHDKVS